MWLLIDIFQPYENTLGTVLSVHRSQEAAERANRAFQKKVKAANGSASYIPTMIRLAKNKRGPGQDVREGDIA